MGEVSDKISGKTNQVIGKATGDKQTQGKGKAQETSGKLKSKAKDAGRALSQKADKVAKKADD